MTSEEYRKFLKELEYVIFNRCPIIGTTNSKSVVSKADMKNTVIVSTKLICMLTN